MDFIQNDAPSLKKWRATYTFPSERIVMGEFGVYRPGADTVSSAQFAQNVRTSAESFGFAWIYWTYAPFDETGLGFSPLKMQGPAPNTFEPAMLKVLGLNAP